MTVSLYTMIVLSQYYHSTIMVLSQYYHSTMIVLSQYYHSTMTVLWRYHHSTIIVLSQCYHSTIIVLPVSQYYHSTITILSQWYCCRPHCDVATLWGWQVATLRRCDLHEFTLPWSGCVGIFIFWAEHPKMCRECSPVGMLLFYNISTSGCYRLGL